MVEELKKNSLHFIYFLIPKKRGIAHKMNANSSQNNKDFFSLKAVFFSKGI